jgi:hypothetical protein
MGENSEIMKELKRQDKCRIQDKEKLDNELRKTNSLINDQRTESRRLINDQRTESREIKKMIEKQSNESKEQCDEIKESLSNIKVDIVRVEAETKKEIENLRTGLRAEMEEKLEEKLLKCNMNLHCRTYEKRRS